MAASAPIDGSVPRYWDQNGLPAWTYFSTELLEIEKQQLFRQSLQLVCHTSDVAHPGDWRTLDAVGDRALIIRGQDDVVRAFHNVCPHRGSRVVARERGSYKSVVVCPFHGWSFHLDGQHCYDEPYVDGTSRSVGRFNERPGKLWSMQQYKNILPTAECLPESHRHAWVYLGMFPNTVIGLYPDSVVFHQGFALSVDRTLPRGAVYRRPDEDRALRAARYLSVRIDWLTAQEDRELIKYPGVMLFDLEYGMRTYHDHLRAAIPVCNHEQGPARGTVAVVNQVG